jgi:hypothetical protein
MASKSIRSERCSMLNLPPNHLGDSIKLRCATNKRETTYRESGSAKMIPSFFLAVRDRGGDLSCNRARSRKTIRFTNKLHH